MLSVFLLACAVLLTFLQAFSFAPPWYPFCKRLDELSFTSASAQPPTLVFEDPGTIKVMHGSGCAHSKDDFLKVEQSIDIPAYANKAAVFLNGWKLKYSDGDHHVGVMATVIGKISFEPGKLTWNAMGALGDEGHDKAIDWCDWYTVVAWNDTNLHAFVDQGDAEHFCKSGGTPSGSDTFFFAENTGTSTALSWFRSFLSNSNFASDGTAAVLPRGFGFRYLSFDEDHHVLQVAYNLEHSEIFTQDQSYKKAEGELHPLPTPPTGRVDSGFVSWSTYGIFKDNDTRRDYQLGEFVSSMGGPDVGVIQPPFAILPFEGAAGCVGYSADVKTENVIIDNVPYTYAIPMLTGWDLSYCSDHHVREVGIWIDDLHYDKAPNAPTGTLRYKLSSVLRDDSDNGHAYQHKVTILGLRPLAGGKQ